MYAWIYLLLVFILGCAVGGILSALLFRAKLRVYKRLIEKYLDSVNLPSTSRKARSKREMLDRQQDMRQSTQQGSE
jgi:hypothetical protein